MSSCWAGLHINLPFRFPIQQNIKLQINSFWIVCRESNPWPKQSLLVFVTYLFQGVHRRDLWRAETRPGFDSRPVELLQRRVSVQVFTDPELEAGADQARTSYKTGRLLEDLRPVRHLPHPLQEVHGFLEDLQNNLSTGHQIKGFSFRETGSFSNSSSRAFNLTSAGRSPTHSCCLGGRSGQLLSERSEFETLFRKKWKLLSTS